LSSEAASLETRGADEGVQELWRLAQEVSPSLSESENEDWGVVPGTLSEGSQPLGPGGFGGGLGSSLGSLGKGLGSGSGGVRDQTPEEALAALRELSSSRSPGGFDEPRDEVDTLLSARALDATPEAEFGLGAADAELRQDLSPAALEDALAGDGALPLLEAGSLEPLDDDELPSILARLTDEPGELEQAAIPAAGKIVEEARPAEEIRAEAEQQSQAGQALVEQGEAGQAEDLEAQTEQAGVSEEEVAALAAQTEDSGAFDLIEEAVESHLEEAEEPAGQRGSSRKVVPFPLSRPVSVSREEPQEPARFAKEPAAGAAGAKTRKLGKGFKAIKGMPGDLSRVQLKPVAVMFGIEPSLYALDDDAQSWLPAGMARPGGDGAGEPPMCYPDSGGGRRAGARLPVHARLFPVLPEMPDSEPLEGHGGVAEGPVYTLPFETPLPLAARRNGSSGRKSVGSERAWMFQIEPLLAEGPDFDLELPNGQRHVPWRSPRMPAALLSGVGHANGSGKLDLSGPQGNYEPYVSSLCLVFPECGELGGGVQRQSSNAPGEDLSRWTPPTVLDPRFDIERPAGRDLSDFG
jgi:hypothetical protein